MSDDAVALISIIATLACAILAFPLVRAIARRIEAGRVDPGLAEEVAQLRDRVAELEQERLRMPEIEERLDFAERLLARDNESRVDGRLP